MNFLNRIIKKMYIQNVTNLKYLKKTLLTLMFIKIIRWNMEYGIFQGFVFNENFKK